LQSNTTKVGVTKSELYTEKQNEIANIAKALGHPARIAILEYLMSVESCICGDIVSSLSIAQATVSQHLRELKNAGIIKGNIEGSSICYCIDSKKIDKILKYFSKIKNNLCC
jgi:ArsR family transcriptional regulator, arsenate/arsenite/antimonite-responsive transcriptional repressor